MQDNSQSGNSNQTISKMHLPDATRLEEILYAAKDGAILKPEDAIQLLTCSGKTSSLLQSIASEKRNMAKGRIVTYSRKVFIPLTNLCRDTCSYCTFKQNPTDHDAKSMTPTDVLNVARAGQKSNCTEALFTIGERPEQRYPEYQSFLQSLGYKTTLEYLRYVSELVIQKTGLLPHANPGTMTKKEISSLRDVNVSMGLMLENVSERLCAEGGPHAQAPSKHPKLRLATIKAAGELKVAFTTGLLIGIGETFDEIVQSLYAIRRLNDEYGHIQEVIIQNFRAKQDTPMRNSAEPSHGFMQNLVAVTRLIFDPEMNIQVPPNLSPGIYPEFLNCGINDWGGISPVTADYVNPEAPWPKIATLSQACRNEGFLLKPRLPIYPEFILYKEGFVPEPLTNKVRNMINDSGLALVGDVKN